MSEEQSPTQPAVVSRDDLRRKAIAELPQFVRAKYSDEQLMQMVPAEIRGLPDAMRYVAALNAAAHRTAHAAEEPAPTPYSAEAAHQRTIKHGSPFSPGMTDEERLLVALNVLVELVRSGRTTLESLTPEVRELVEQRLKREA